MALKRKATSASENDEPGTSNVSATRHSRRKRGLPAETDKRTAEEIVKPAPRRRTASVTSSRESSVAPSESISVRQEPATPRRSTRAAKRKTVSSPSSQDSNTKRKKRTTKREVTPVLETVTEVPTPVPNPPEAEQSSIEAASYRDHSQSPDILTQQTNETNEDKSSVEGSLSPTQDRGISIEDVEAIHTIESSEVAVVIPTDHNQAFEAEEDLVADAQNDEISASASEIEEAHSIASSEQPPAAEGPNTTSNGSTSIRQRIAQNLRALVSAPDKKNNDTDNLDALNDNREGNVITEDVGQSSASAALPDQATDPVDDQEVSDNEGSHSSAEVDGDTLDQTQHGGEDVLDSSNADAAQSKGISYFMNFTYDFVSGPFRKERSTEHEHVAAIPTEDGDEKEVSIVTSDSPKNTANLEVALEERVRQGLVSAWQRKDNLAADGIFKGRNAVTVNNITCFEPDLTHLRKLYTPALKLPCTDPIELKRANREIFVDSEEHSSLHYEKLTPGAILREPELRNFLLLIWSVMTDNEKASVALQQKAQLAERSERIQDLEQIEQKNDQQVSRLHEELLRAQSRIRQLEVSEGSQKQQIAAMYKDSLLVDADRDHYRNLAAKFARESIAAENEKKRKEHPEEEVESGPMVKVIRTEQGRRRVIGENENDFQGVNALLDGRVSDGSESGSPERASRKRRDFERRRTAHRVGERIREEDAEEERIRRLIQPPSQGGQYFMSGALAPTDGANEGSRNTAAVLANHAVDGNTSRRASSGQQASGDAAEQVQEQHTPQRGWRLTSVLSPITSWFSRTPQTAPAPRLRPIAQPRRRLTSASNMTDLSAGITTSSTSNQPVNDTLFDEQPRPNPSVNNTPVSNDLTFNANRRTVSNTVNVLDAPNASNAAGTFTPRARGTVSNAILPFESLAPPLSNSTRATPGNRLQSIRRRRQIERDEAAAAAAAAAQTPSKTGDKRKHSDIDNLKEIPNPSGSSYGMDPKYFEISDEEDDDAEDERVSSGPGLKSSKPNRNTRNPYVYNRYARPSKRIVDDGNVFKSYEERIIDAVGYGKQYGVWTGPRRTESELSKNAGSSGYFAVPDDSDTDSNYSQDDEPESPTMSKADKVQDQDKQTGASVADDANQTLGSLSPDAIREIATAYNAEDLATTQDNSATVDTDLDDSNDHTHLLRASADEQPAPEFDAPDGPQSSSQNTGTEALARARSQAEKYKPKTPSGLRTASRLSSSPAMDGFSSIGNGNPNIVNGQGFDGHSQPQTSEHDSAAELEWPKPSPITNDHWPRRNFELEEHYFNEFMQIAQAAPPINASV